MKEKLEKIYRALADNTECIGIGYEEEMLSIISYVKELEHFKDTIASQTEISDKEIEKASNEGWVALDSSRTDNWIRGAKWYREQLKNK